MVSTKPGALPGAVIRPPPNASGKNSTWATTIAALDGSEYPMPRPISVNGTAATTTAPTAARNAERRDGRLGQERRDQDHRDQRDGHQQQAGQDAAEEARTGAGGQRPVERIPRLGAVLGDADRRTGRGWSSSPRRSPSRRWRRSTPTGSSPVNGTTKNSIDAAGKNALPTSAIGMRSVSMSWNLAWVRARDDMVAPLRPQRTGGLVVRDGQERLFQGGGADLEVGEGHVVA